MTTVMAPVVATLDSMIDAPQGATLSFILNYLPDVTGAIDVVVKGATGELPFGTLVRAVTQVIDDTVQNLRNNDDTATKLKILIQECVAIVETFVSTLKEIDEGAAENFNKAFCLFPGILIKIAKDCKEWKTEKKWLQRIRRSREYKELFNEHLDTLRRYRHDDLSEKSIYYFTMLTQKVGQEKAASRASRSPTSLFPFSNPLF